MESLTFPWQITLHNYGNHLDQWGYIPRIPEADKKLSKDCQNSNKKLQCCGSVIHYSMGAVQFPTSLEHLCCTLLLLPLPLSAAFGIWAASCQIRFFNLLHLSATFVLSRSPLQSLLKPLFLPGVSTMWWLSCQEFASTATMQQPLVTTLRTVCLLLSACHVLTSRRLHDYFHSHSSLLCSFSLHPLGLSMLVSSMDIIIILFLSYFAGITSMIAYFEFLTLENSND